MPTYGHSVEYVMAMKADSDPKVRGLNPAISMDDLCKLIR
jgi:hypothetical protein